MQESVRNRYNHNYGEPLWDQFGFLVNGEGLALVECVMEPGQDVSLPVVLPDSVEEYIVMAVEDVEPILPLPRPNRRNTRMVRANDEGRSGLRSTHNHCS